jgi:hypothetical protein
MKKDSPVGNSLTFFRIFVRREKPCGCSDIPIPFFLKDPNPRSIHGFQPTTYDPAAQSIAPMNPQSATPFSRSGRQLSGGGRHGEGAHPAISVFESSARAKKAALLLQSFFLRYMGGN